MPEPTPEQAITEAMNAVDEMLAASQPAPYCGNDAYAKLIAQALRARGLLVGAPTEKQRFEATYALARSIHGVDADHEDWDYYRKHVDAALDAAAGVAPQEPSGVMCPACDVDPAAPHNGKGACPPKPAPSPDREKLIAEAFPFDGSDPDTVIECRRRVRELIASLAAAPVLDEEKLAEALRGHTVRRGTFECKCGWFPTIGDDDLGRHQARVVAEALRGGGR